MKKIGKILLIVWAVLATFLLVMSCIAYNEADAEWSAKYDDLQKEYTELSNEFEDVSETAVDPMDLLPYKLFYDAEMQILLGNDHDWEKAAAEAAEEYNLSEIEQALLLKKIEWLITMVTTITE